MAVSGVWYQNRNDRCMQKTLKAINDLKYHIICSIVFVICYFGFQLLSGGYYDGSEIVFSGWQKAVHTIFAFGTGLFPLKAYWENCRNISLFDLVSNIHVGGYIVALLVATGVVWLLPKVREIKFTEWAIISGISLISVFLPCIPYGFTEKYVDWISNGTYGYVPSYYGYFYYNYYSFISNSCLSVLSLEEVFKVVTWCVLFGVCILTAVNNSKTQNAYAFGTQRYISFENIVSSSEFAEIEDGAIVYIPDYTGIHGTMWRSEQYLKVYTDKQIKLTKDRNELDFSHPVYEIRYFAGSGITAMARIDNNYYTNDLYLIANGESLIGKTIECSGKFSIIETDAKDMVYTSQGIDMNALKIY